LQALRRIIARNLTIWKNQDQTFENFFTFGEVIQAHGIGTVVINLLDENYRESTAQVQKVFYVPEVKSNVLSVKKLCEKGLRAVNRGGFKYLYVSLQILRTVVDFI
jgi:hypothetical protein